MITVSIESVSIRALDETQAIIVNSPEAVPVYTDTAVLKVSISDAAAVINPVPENYGLISWNGSVLRIT